MLEDGLGDGGAAQHSGYFGDALVGGEGRYGYGQIILAGSHLIVTSDEGGVALVKASPDKYTEVARFLAVQGQTWNYPAIAEGRLLVRNSNEMAAFDISGK